jgi:two-component system response regulator CpxR
VGTSILVVDDDVELCQLVREYLASEPWEIECVHEGVAGLDRALQGDHQLVILDIMLPGMSGLDVLRHLREKRRTPVLMLTARGEDVDRIVGLEMGADDYLPKPFNPRELVARLRAILRRAEGPSVADLEARPIEVGDLRLDPRSRELKLSEAVVPLTAVEFDMVRALMLSAGRVVGREELSRAALGRPWSPYDRAVDMHVSNLRRKLKSGPRQPERIKTVRSSGYLLAPVERSK